MSSDPAKLGTALSWEGCVWLCCRCFALWDCFFLLVLHQAEAAVRSKLLAECQWKASADCLQLEKFHQQSGPSISCCPGSRVHLEDCFNVQTCQVCHRLSVSSSWVGSRLRFHPTAMLSSQIGDCSSSWDYRLILCCWIENKCYDTDLSLIIHSESAIWKWSSKVFSH